MGFGHPARPRGAGLSPLHREGSQSSEGKPVTQLTWPEISDGPGLSTPSPSSHLTAGAGEAAAWGMGGPGSSRFCRFAGKNAGRAQPTWANLIPEPRPSRVDGAARHAGPMSPAMARHDGWGDVPAGILAHLPGSRVTSGEPLKPSGPRFPSQLTGERHVGAKVTGEAKVSA